MFTIIVDPRIIERFSLCVDLSGMRLHSLFLLLNCINKTGDDNLSWQPVLAFYFIYSSCHLEIKLSTGLWPLGCLMEQLWICKFALNPHRRTESRMIYKSCINRDKLCWLISVGLIEVKGLSNSGLKVLRFSVLKSKPAFSSPEIHLQNQNLYIKFCSLLSACL